MERNPEPIQVQDDEWDSDDIQKHAVPLFLIHDGGGTTFTYHCLDALGRPTYGIFNPQFRNGGRLEGGICGTARLYAGIIRQTCLERDFPAERNSDGSVNILIGGWSLGGLLSLEIAKEMTGDRDVRIIGLLMVDTMYTVVPPTVRLESLDELDLGNTNPNEFLALQAMKEAWLAITEWNPPVWAGDQAAQRPRISLLRACDAIPTGSDRVHFVDVYRDSPSLGWHNYEADLFTEIIEATGDHFEIFSSQNTPNTSQLMKRCLDTLETLGPEPY